MAIDDKYIVCCSIENTIKIWNRLQKKQETVLKENGSNLISEGVVCNCKCVVSFSEKLSNHNIKCFRK